MWLTRNENRGRGPSHARPCRLVEDFIFYPKNRRVFKRFEDFKLQVTYFSFTGCWWEKGLEGVPGE